VTATVDGIVAALTVEEKVSLMAGADWWHTPAVERVGVPRLKVTDGPVGARGAENASGPPSACFPCGTALAATWDVDLVHRVGVELGREAMAKGAHVLLAPTVNLHRTPLAGRNFECFSEDPHLTARMAVAYVSGVQREGVGCCIKHFVANDSEHERFTISSDVPERALRELYLRPFEVAVAESKPWAVMSAYNKLDGTWCSENRWLLTNVLRGEWGFDGMVISDWWGTHSTVDAANAGLDLEMPGPPEHRGAELLDAVRRGEVAEAVVDAAVRRLLRTLERAGALEHGAVGEERGDDTPARRAVARDAARSGIVLLRNEDGALPLEPSALRTVAVVGPNADAPTILGGGSASVSPYYAVTVLEGLRARLARDGVDVVHEPGCSITRYPPSVDLRWVTTPAGEPGIAIEIVEGDQVVARQTTRRAALMRHALPGQAPWSARFEATFRAPATGRHVFQGAGTGRFRVWLDDELVVDGWDPPAGADADAALRRGRRVEGGTHLAEGEERHLRAEYVPAPGGADAAVVGGGGLELRCQPPLPVDAFERAVAAASAADAVVVVVGTNGDWETEGRDRRTMDLPGRQVELIDAVAAVNGRAIVVVNAGSPVTMDWVARVPAVLQSWFLGQETGNAVADVLTGDVDASGRLPTTIPRAITDTPSFTNYPGEAGHVLYGEGVFMGYRWYDARATEPAFAFGHGLSYTTFDVGQLDVAVHGTTVDVGVPVTNVGGRDGTAVVQLYVHDVEASVARPPKELRAFAKVRVAAGATEVVHLHLGDDAFAFWDAAEHRWQVEPGEVELLVGMSSRDIRQRASVTIG
jgi:beta-glucosidase